MKEAWMCDGSLQPLWPSPTMLPVQGQRESYLGFQSWGKSEAVILEDQETENP